jgi:hypothetical protein
MATAQDSSRKRSKISLFPTDEQIRAGRGRLLKFEAHDLRSILDEAKANGKEDLEIAFVMALRRRNEKQMKELLRCLGIDASKADAWQRGFFRLANLHHGVGQLASYPRRTSKNATTWTSDHDLALLREVMILRQKGLSERRAVKKLVADRKKRELFPYRRKGYFASTKELQNREDALWARLQKIKRSKFADVLGLRRDRLSPIELNMLELDVLNALPEELVKNKTPSRMLDL